MSFEEMKQLLKNGKLVTKGSWRGFKFLKAVHGRIFGYEAETGKCSLSFVPAKSELEATDWEEYAPVTGEAPAGPEGE